MQEEKPLVSIITITFNLIKANREKSFRQNLESVHNQTHKNIEHIIIDGFSSDGTVDLIKEYANKGWIKYVSEPDKGIYDAMNKGIKLAKGKYIAFLNSDDYYHDERGVSKSVEALEENAADFSYAPAVIKFENGTLFSDHPQCNPKISTIFFAMPFCHQTMFTKREVMLKENMFDTSYKSAADYDFVIRLCLKKYKSVFVNETFVTYQFEGVSSTEQENSLNETADIWRRRYGNLFSMTDEIIKAMRKNIYSGNYYGGIPLELAKKLKKLEPYFDYAEYLKYSGIKNNSEKKIFQKRCSKLSIITITYNNSDLKRTLDSILDQKNIQTEIEHIIIDNLSTDDTEKIVNNYKDKASFDVIYIRERDKGRYDAMNKGIKVASGEYLSFMNAGDQFFNQNAIRDILNFSEDYDLVYGNLNVIENGKESVYCPPEIVDFKYFLSSTLPHQASVIKKEFLERIGYYDDSLEIVSDWKFFLLAICKSKCSYNHINKTIATYYFDGISSQTENSKKIEKEKNKVLNEAFSQAETETIGSVKNFDQQDDFKTPILFLIFNRPDTTQKVFEEIRKIKPRYLYVAADGFRKNIAGEREVCQQTRNIIKEIDWDCKLKILFRKENFGCGRGVSGAISWFFDNVREGIILEDDCFPDQSFFSYCEKMLEKYRNDNRISHINGTSFVCKNNNNEDSYYFSKYYHVWGWATWRRTWDWYDFPMRNFPQFKLSNHIKNIFPEKSIQNFWLHCFEETYSQQRDTWDFQWVYANLINNGLSVMPYKNLISNIGFGEKATHTKYEDDKSANRSVEKIGKITHPLFVVCNSFLDKSIYANHVGLSLDQSVNFQFGQLMEIEKNKTHRYSLEDFFDKLQFAIFSPRKFFRKYWKKILKSKLRQPMRKIWYTIRFKKIK